MKVCATCKMPIEEIGQVCTDGSYLCMTEEELAKMIEADREESYARMMRYVAGNVNEYGDGVRVGSLQGDIAKRLIADDPTLADHARRMELLDKVEDIYRRDHLVTVMLTDDQMNMARLLCEPEGSA